MNTIDLIVPGLLGPFSTEVSENPPVHIRQQLREADFQSLKKWLGRAEVLLDRQTTYYATLVDQIGVSLQLPENSLSQCKLTARYDGIDTGQGFYYRADPVHFKAETDHAILLGSQLVSPTENETDKLIKLFNQHFLQDNISLHASDPYRWYLRTDRMLDLTFNALDYALGRDIKHFMPQGEDALWWRRILNEAQMLFFQHDVNQQRESKGELTINGLWLWDLSVDLKSLEKGTDEQNRSLPQKIYADNAEAIALVDMMNEQGVPLSIKPYANQNTFEPNSVIVTEQLYASVCYGDIDAWFDALREYCNECLPRIIKLLKTGLVDEVNIYPCDGRMFKVNRRQLIKFWKSVNNIESYFCVHDI